MAAVQLNTELCFKPEKSKKNCIIFDTIQKPEKKLSKLSKENFVLKFYIEPESFSLLAQCNDFGKTAPPIISFTLCI